MLFRSASPEGSGPLKWLGGLYLYKKHQDHTLDLNYGQGAADMGMVPMAMTNAADSDIKTYGYAVFGQATYTLFDKLDLTAGLRYEYEKNKLDYASDYLAGGMVVPGMGSDIRGRKHDDVFLPKAQIAYRWTPDFMTYAGVSRGYRSGGFNTSFLDVSDLAFDPEYSWNYEIGGHFSCMEGAVRGDFALFYIDCRDQQLTVFPPGQTTGRMMTNAGRTRSLGAEAAVQISPWRTFDINLAYGYTDARFVRYETTVKNDDGDPVRISYKDNRIPYAPQHTLSAGAAWTVPTGVKWLGDLVFQAGVRCAGRIWWNEENTLSQPFYALTDASVRFEHARYSLSVWGRNLTDAGYDVFYFKSIGNEFVQRGRPRTFGITLNINI